MANTYLNTDWSADALTKATATSSTVDNVALGGTLTVTGATQLNSTLTVGVDDTGYDVKFFGATATNGYMLWDESTDDLILGSSSRLGIGTDSPNGLLEIYSETNNRPLLYITNHSTTADDEGGNIIFRKGDGAIGATQANLTDNDVLGDIAFQGLDISDNAYITGATIRAQINGTPDTNDMPTELIFYTNSGGDSASQKMCILANGNVGIGTAAPSTPLHVVGNATISGVITSGVTYTQYFGISEINMGTAGYHYLMNNGMMNASPVGGDSSALGNGTDPATTLDFSALTDTDTEDTIAAYWYVPINCTITEVKALATTDGTTSETLRFHVMQYDLDTSSQHGDLANGVLKASSADIASLTAASLKVGAFTLDSADLTAGKIVIVTIEADDASDKISAQVYINYKAR